MACITFRISVKIIATVYHSKWWSGGWDAIWGMASNLL